MMSMRAPRAVYVDSERETFQAMAVEGRDRPVTPQRDCLLHSHKLQWNNIELILRVRDIIHPNDSGTDCGMDVSLCKHM
jgi:hypothetical protein